MAKLLVTLAVSLFVGYLTSNVSASPTPGEVYRVANPAPDQSACTPLPCAAIILTSPDLDYIAHTALKSSPSGNRENILGRSPFELLSVAGRTPSTSWDDRRAIASGTLLLHSSTDKDLSQ
ncbi:hypothetical protein NMY22_g9326 [Coprinellus aureogranulatus]|nr:hypothetical protein NMY22_g9326 [Coprinellus aureogranulatus]